MNNKMWFSLTIHLINFYLVTVHANVKCHIYPDMKMLECSSRVLELEQVERFLAIAYNIKLLWCTPCSRSPYISFFGTDPQETEALKHVLGVSLLYIIIIIIIIIISIILLL